MPSPVRASPYPLPATLLPPAQSCRGANPLVLRVVMAMVASRDSTLALSVSADHLVGRYDLKVAF